MGAISPKLQQVEFELSRRKPTANLSAHDCFLRGYESFRLDTAESYETALGYFRKAIELDPGYAAAYALAARTFSRRIVDGMVDDVADAIRQGEVYVQKAIELGQDDELALVSGNFR